MHVAIRAPSDAETAQARQDDGRHTFGQLTELLLRKHGVVPARPGAVASPTVNVLPRATVPTDAELEGPCLAEGPLSARTARRLSIRTADERLAAALELRAASGGKIATLAHTAFRVRVKHPGTGARGDRYRMVPEDPLWPDGDIRFQPLEPSSGWRTVLTAHDGEDEHVVAVTDGRRLVLGIPLLDVLLGLMAYPPFPDGYNGVTSHVVEPSIERWLIRQLRMLVRGAGGTWVQLARWPGGARWAHGIRHDYDRLLSDRQLRTLLGEYERLGARSTWYFLNNRTIGHQARLLRSAGHEVALHTTARTGEDFARELHALEREAGFRVRGATAHGGRAVGYLGGHHVAWSNEHRLLHGETLGRLSTLPFVGFHLAGERLERNSFVHLATHRSLDAGMGPDQHQLESVLAGQVAARGSGDYFLVMNHPDIHLEQLLHALEHAELESAWCATAAQVARWTRDAHYGAEWEQQDGRFSLVLPRAIDLAVVVGVEHPGDAPATSTLPPGSTRLAIQGGPR